MSEVIVNALLLEVATNQHFEDYVEVQVTVIGSGFDPVIWAMVGVTEDGDANFCLHLDENLGRFKSMLLDLKGGSTEQLNVTFNLEEGTCSYTN